MSDEARNLNRIQRWMQAVITHPAGIEAGIGSSDARSHIDVPLEDVERVITPSCALDSISRMSVYGNAYFARLLECMRQLFPALVHALGEEVFDQFTLAYLQKHPSQSYTLNRLADHFVQFLEATRPDWSTTVAAHPSAEGALETPRATGPDTSGPDTSGPAASWPDFVIDLARLEWSIDDVFDGPGVEGEPLLTAEQLAVVPPERWDQARLVPVVCLRLLSFQYPVNDYYTAFRRGQAPPLPEAASTFVALTRREYVVRRHALSQPQWQLLSALAAGQPLGVAVAACAETWDDVDTLAISLQNWFRRWAASGFFQRVELPD